MSVEELGLGALDESGGTGAEVSEEEKKKVAEDGKKAQQTHKQIKELQKKYGDFALFLSKVLKRYYNNNKIIVGIYSLIHNLEENQNQIIVIFKPFVNGEKFSKISDYLNYLQSSNIDIVNKELVFDLMEEEKVGGENFWNSLKKGNSEISYENFKDEFLKSL